ncbi:hypothetical protein LshimejAT787_1201030 [Lyophyllum shimeji]|uniref:Proteophosphoglycan ppg4 n=1 Tax=Lyophyllum shimeji TaxID=47721 RepID=A0A9P3UPE1_LYOSH|nr:hypothetical protein LshimejAT787_1201030 [Lyophyllum shimeji]
MPFYSRMSRQSTPDQPPNSSSTPGSSPINGQGDTSEQPSSSSRRRMSKDSEGYPSWLPKRPPPPAPASTFHSSVGLPEAGPSEPRFLGGRKPTPRSVRIVSLQESYAEQSRREPTDQTRVGYPTRVWSKAAGAAMSPAVFSSGDPFASRAPQPKFRSRGLNLELLQNPSFKSRLYFYLYPILAFAHIPLQTFFDFNTVFILFQVSKFPNPEAPGVPGSGRNWALGAAAYIACWLVWIFVVTVVYELVYSFARRWRVKRPLMLPIYLSSSAFNLVSMTSYTNFCFLQHIRYSAFFGESGSLRDGLAETFWFYSQNLPTVALLLPRAGLALALLLAFSTPQVGEVVLADAGIHHRDTTFFRAQDGTLTNYAGGILIANAAWTAWRVLVLFTSLIGLWIVSGQGCAGLCGPRYRWEEEEAEKTRSFYSENSSIDDVIPWSWRECTRMRVQEAYDFCLTVRPPLRWSGKKEASDGAELLGEGETFDGVQQVLAAVGFPSVPPPARRSVLTGELFEKPKDEPPAELSDIIPKVVKRSSKDKQVAGPSAPMMSLPYPFTAAGAHVSSADKVPFPPSPKPSGSKKMSSGSGSGSGSGSTEEEEEDEEEDEEEEEEEEEVDEEGSEEPSTGRASGSMSSLGQPVSSRYPFQFRRPGRGNSMSSGGASHATPTSNSRSMQSRFSQATQSTGNRESTDSHSPRSHTSSSDVLSSNSGIPMPPRHPQQGQRRGRQRAGTVPAATSPTSSPSIAFPTTTRRPRAQTRAEAGSLSSDVVGVPALGSDEAHDDSMIDDHASEASQDHEAAERDDQVGLLSSGAPSPRTSLRNRGSTVSLHRSSRSGSNSRTNSHAGSSSSRSRAGSISIPVSMRSRAQSLIQNIGAASHSSLELVQTVIRSRANSSMARLAEDHDGSYYETDRTHSRSGSGSVSANENYTFGQPIRMQFPVREQEPLEEEQEQATPAPASPSPPPPPHDSLSDLSFTGLSQSEPHRTSSPEDTTMTGRGLSSPEPEFATPMPSSPVDIPRSAARLVPPTESATSSPPDISTAAQSFVTAPATITETTESSGGRTISSWGEITHMVDRSDSAWRPA